MGVVARVIISPPRLSLFPFLFAVACVCAVSASSVLPFVSDYGYLYRKRKLTNRWMREFVLLVDSEVHYYASVNDPPDQPAGTFYVATNSGKAFHVKQSSKRPHCFPAEDTRLLTSDGFLFLDQILARPDPTSVLFACYDVASQTVVYRRATQLVVDDTHTALVEFTDAGEKRHWTEPESGTAAADNDDEVQGPRRKSNHYSLRVTPDHDMYVQQVGREGSPFAKLPASAALLTAEERQSGSTAARASIRQMCYVPGGVGERTSDGVKEVAQRLNLTTGDQVDAFMELYGCWLGDERSTLDRKRLGVRFKQPRQATDVAWLRETLGRVGLAEGEWAVESNDDTQSDSAFVVVTAARWWAYFVGEYNARPSEDDKDAPTAGRRAPEAATSSSREIDMAHADEDVQSSANNKCLWWWVLRDCSQAHQRLVLRGLQRAGGEKWTTGRLRHVLFTSSAAFRDQLMQLLVHAGYTAYFAARPAHHAEPAPEEQMAQLKSATAGRDARAVWRIRYCLASDSLGGDSKGSAASMPQLHLATEVRRVDFRGRVWCPTVDHPDHLVIAQRAHRTPSGVVTRVSRATIVGQCLGVINPSRTFYLAAETEREYLCWVNAIHQATKRLQDRAKMQRSARISVVTNHKR